MSRAKTGDGAPVSSRLKGRMIELDVSIQDVASAVGVSKATAGRWYIGELQAPEAHHKALARYLGVTVAWLAHGEAPKAAHYQPLTPTEKRLVSLRTRLMACELERRALRREIKAREAEEAEALAAAELADFHRGAP